MNDTKTKQDGQKNYIVKRIIDAVLALLLIAGVIFGIKAVTGDFNSIERLQNSGEESIKKTESKKPDPSSTIYVTEVTYNGEISMGPLIVVNDKLEYKGNNNDIVSMYDVRQNDGTKVYAVMDAGVMIRSEAANELNDMLKAFASETGHDDMVVSGGYRSVEEQQEIYDNAEDASAIAKPGFSDYHTGYSVDFGVAADDGTVKDFTGLKDYSWFEKNCYRYGFVLRFPDGKKEFTGYDYRPWHFRYVGKAHAFYMYKNNLCLEEYVEKLKSFEYTQTHLIFSDDNGNEYETYYYPIDNSATSTILAVPDKDYELSGNNSDGYIITFLVNSAAEDETQPEASDAAAAGQPAQTTAADNTAQTTAKPAETKAAQASEKTAETTKNS